MANAEKAMPIILKWEGGYSDHPNDSGGCTMRGITIGTFRRYYGKDKTCDDLRRISDDQWLHIFKSGYWDKMKCDFIENQSLANLVIDMGWGSGTVTAIKKIQKCLGTTADGIVGPKTLALLNAPDREATFNKLWEMRRLWFNNIVKNNPSQKVFLNGWLRRLNDYKYEEDVPTKKRR